MSSGEKYAAAAYAVVFLTVLVWVAIIALKVTRLERERRELSALLDRSAEPGPPNDG